MSHRKMPHNIIHRGHDGFACRGTRCEPLLDADLVPALTTSLVIAACLLHATVRVVGAAVAAEYGTLFHAVLTLGTAEQWAQTRPLPLVLALCFSSYPRCADYSCARLSNGISKAHFFWRAIPIVGNKLVDEREELSRPPAGNQCPLPTRKEKQVMANGRAVVHAESNMSLLARAAQNKVVAIDVLIAAQEVLSLGARHCGKKEWTATQGALKRLLGRLGAIGA